ncbi:MAG TPA: hypothetical protein VE090_02985 [Methylomirabilota bacterium]|nr:hypothetical protein [Methylomirabilota bacterium]
MEKKKKIKSINLLPNKGDDLINDFLGWALTVGRLLIIVTETLALSVFAYRFSLDRQIIDLHDKIKTESIIVQNFKSGEDTYRNLQARLASVDQYDTLSDTTLTITKDIIDMGRNKVTFKNLIVGTNTAEIDVQAPSATSLSLFTQALKNYPNITGVSVDRVENKTSSAIINVSITGQLKNAAFVVQPTQKPGTQQ